jgi:hypothetical protein
MMGTDVQSQSDIECEGKGRVVVGTFSLVHTHKTHVPVTVVPDTKTNWSNDHRQQDNPNRTGPYDAF